MRVVLGDRFTAPHGLVEISNFDPYNNTVYIHEGDGHVLVRLYRHGGCKHQAKVRAACYDVTAKQGSDYHCRSKEFTWENGDCSQRIFYIWINDDLQYEQDESFYFIIKPIGYTALGFDRLQIIIAANDSFV